MRFKSGDFVKLSDNVCRTPIEAQNRIFIFKEMYKNTTFCRIIGCANKHLTTVDINYVIHATDEDLICEL